MAVIGGAYLTGGSPMFDRKRRQFIALLGGAAAWPLAARAQQARKTHTIGLLSPATPPDPRARIPGYTAVGGPFSNGLRELGWIEGQNITIERRYAENRLERLPELAAELVRLNVEVIVAAGTLGPLAAKRASSTIPIVMTAAGDPLGSGLIASLAHPGGNVTGLSLMVPNIAGKRLQLLKEILPRLNRVAVLWIMAWSVDRLGRSLQDLVGFLSEIHTLRIDLYLHQQGLDTTTPAGKAMF
jgi:putative ABC transport system substrate-binding protein